MAEVPTALQERLESTIAGITDHPDLDNVARDGGQTRAAVDDLVATYCNEARMGLRLIAPLVKDDVRILEIGSGLGVLAKALADAGFRTTAIEPVAAGFGFMRQLGTHVRNLGARQDNARWLEMGAEALNPRDHGTFDLIFSTNVLEHIPDLDAAFAGMTSVLAPDGRMIHLCPNYVVPYEPHFGIPLVPFFPRATRPLFRKRLTIYPGVWDELNFITAGRVRRIARRHKLEVSFDRGVMAAMMVRLKHDTVYRQRQRGIASIVQWLLKVPGAIGLIERIPGSALTPMVMRLRHARRTLS